MTIGRFCANTMEVVFWQTEQIPQAHFLQLVFLRGANLEERGDKVSEQPEEERAKLGCGQQAGEHFLKWKTSDKKKTVVIGRWPDSIYPQPLNINYPGQKVCKMLLCFLRSLSDSHLLTKKISFCLFCILRKYRWRLFHLPLHCVGHTIPMYFISITNKKTPLTSLFQFSNRKLKQRVQVEG